jgi:hypothetical protein
MNNWVLKKAVWNKYFTVYKPLSELSELLPQPSRASLRFLKRPHDFFNLFLKLIYNTPPLKSISVRTNHIKRGTNQGLQSAPPSAGW